MSYQVSETQRQQQVERLKAIAVGKISRRIDFFIDSNIAEFGEIIDGDEIRRMIANKARSYSQHVIIGQAEL